MGSDDAGKPCASCSSDGNSDCLCRPVGASTEIAVIMAQSYAVVLVVLAIGFVAFVLLLSYLGFEHPEKAQVFLNNFAMPAMGLIAAYAAKACHEYVTQTKSKP